MKNSAVIIVGHGSKSADAVNDFELIVKSLQEKKKDAKVRGAHMELAEPSIQEVVKNLHAEGVTQFTLVPYFLYNGLHIKEDIPEIIEELKQEYADTTFVFGKPIGFDPLMTDILLKRVEEAQAV